MTLDHATLEPAPTKPRRRFRIVLIAAALALGLLAWEWRHPEDPFENGYGISGKRPVGFTVWTVLLHSNWSGPDELTILDLEANIPNDGARVEIEYVVCELDTDVLDAEGVGSVGYGLGDRFMERACARAYPAEGAKLRRDGGRPQELLVGVTATQPGPTRIRGFDVTYRAGWRSGRSHIHVDVDLRGK